jgi:hypothetical protein
MVLPSHVEKVLQGHRVQGRTLERSPCSGAFRLESNSQAPGSSPGHNTASVPPSCSVRVRLLKNTLSRLAWQMSTSQRKSTSSAVLHARRMKDQCLSSYQCCTSSSCVQRIAQCSAYTAGEPAVGAYEMFSLPPMGSLRHAADIYNHGIAASERALLTLWLTFFTAVGPHCG